MTPDRPGRGTRATISIVLLAGLLVAALPSSGLARDEASVSFGKLDKPFGSFGLVPVADATGLVDGSGFPIAGATAGLDGADIVLSAVGVVKLNKNRARQARDSWNKARHKAGAGGALEAGRYLVAVIETAGPPDGEVVFYALLDGPNANDAVPGFPLDPRNGYELAMLFGVLGGSIAVGDTEVAGQALADGLQFYNVPNETTVWRKGSTWYVMRPVPRGATVAELRSQHTIGDRQVFDHAAPGPAALGADAVAGLRCFNAIGTPAGAFDGGPATSNVLQLNLVLDGSQSRDLDPAGLRLVPVDGADDPITPDVIGFAAFGSTLVNFPGVPNGRHRLEAATPGAEPIARLLPSVLRFDGTSAGGLSGGIACGSTLEGIYRNAVDPCSFADPAAIAGALGLDASTVTAFPAANPDGSQSCVWGGPDAFAAATYGVRLVGDLDLVRTSLAACEQADLPGDVPAFVAVCPGLVQHVQLTDAGLGEGVGFPSGTAFLLGQDPAVDAYLAQVTAALAAGDVASVVELLEPVLATDALGYAGHAAATGGFLEDPSTASTGA